MSLVITLFEMFQMAVYFDQKCQAPFPGQNTDLQFHKTHAILAVASFSETSGASVTIYGEEVCLANYLSMIKLMIMPRCFSP
jgi:hypothetical protein